MIKNILTIELEKSLLSLKEALLILNPSKLERDGIIKRFEYTFELSWKIGKKHLENLGIRDLNSPKGVIREMASNQLINSPDIWFTYLDNRNLTSHTYKELNAEKVYMSIPSFAYDCEQLILKLKSENL